MESSASAPHDSLDLNFVDPPIDAGMAPFQPVIGPQNAAGALQEIAARLRNSEKFNWALDEDAEEIAAAIEDPTVAKVYAESVPFIARFLTVELDTATNPSKGIGRVARGDPPPRFGDKYKKRLESPEVRHRLGVAIEQLALHGFAGAVADNVGAKEPASIIEVPIGDWWRSFVSSLGPTYWDINVFDPGESVALGLLILISEPAVQRYSELVREHKLGRSLGRVRAATYANYFVALGWTLFFTRTARADR